MAEYIEREAFIKWVEETYCKPCEEAKRDYNHCRCGSCQYDDMMRDAESFPAADVQPVRHGRWELDVLDGTPGYRPVCIVCSECHRISYAGFPYCPNCGAKMDRGETE